MSFYEEILKGLPASIVSDWPVQVFISHLIKAIANLGHARFIRHNLPLDPGRRKLCAGDFGSKIRKRGIGW